MRRNKKKSESQESPIIELVDEKIKDVLSVQVLFSKIKFSFIDLGKSQEKILMNN